MPIPNELPEQIKLALDIAFGLKGYERQISSDELKLLKIESPTPMPDDIKIAARDILFETILFSLPREPEPMIDLREVAVDLLRRIADNGGIIPRERIDLPDEMIAQFEQEGVVRKTVNGLVWGRNARRAIQMVEQEANRDGKYTF